MTQDEFLVKSLEVKSDLLFAACLQFLSTKDEVFLPTIAALSKELKEKGYHSTFNSRHRLLTIQTAFAHLSELSKGQATTEADRLLPRKRDVDSLPAGE